MALQVYSVRDSLLCLTGTAEVPLGAYHMDQILGEAQLPIKMAAFGHCFRTEAGSGGEAINSCNVAPAPRHALYGWHFVATNLERLSLEQAATALGQKLALDCSPAL